MSRTNFAVITWSKGGWVSVFSKEAVFTPDDLRRQRMGTSADLKEINTVFRTMGFQAVETVMGDIGTKLANNVINSTYLIPEVIVPLGLHRYLTNMLDMPIAPVMGAIVMNRVTWNKISREQQAELIKVTQRIVSEFESTMTRTAANAVAAMQRDKQFKLNKPTQSQEEMWRSEVNKIIPMLLGTTFDRTLYNQINVILDRSRNRQ
jgi:TRAP-type C4-dicarboxylate transport system substrate-binding protein